MRSERSREPIFQQYVQVGHIEHQVHVVCDAHELFQTFGRGVGGACAVLLCEEDGRDRGKSAAFGMEYAFRPVFDETLLSVHVVHFVGDVVELFEDLGGARVHKRLGLGGFDGEVLDPQCEMRDAQVADEASDLEDTVCFCILLRELAEGCWVTGDMGGRC